MFMRSSIQQSWENTHTIQQYAIYTEPNPMARDQMEDAFFYQDISETECIFGVLDGHNGREVVEFVAKNLPQILSQNLIQNKSLLDLTDLLIDTFLQLDDLIKEQISQKAQASGTTCTLCVIRNENQEKVLYTANIGDSKGLIFQKESNKIDYLTVDHRASNEFELLRIKKAGGYVSMGRIMGELEVSRAFGDFIHKNNGVCAIPNISRMVLEENTSALYNIILASDGLWDYVSCDKVNEVVKKFNSSGAIANELRRCAKEGRSKDNICVMAVQVDFSVNYKNILG